MEDRDTDAGFDFNYEEIQKKLNPEKEEKSEESEEKEEETISDEVENLWEEDEEIEEGEEEKLLDKDEEEQLEEKEEEETEEVEEKEEEKKKELPEDEAFKQEVIKTLGEDAYLKVKGATYDIKDLTPEEVKRRLQMGSRFYQAMEEVSHMRNELNQGIQQVKGMMAQQGQGGQVKSTMQTKPEFLKPTEYDTDEVKALKEYAGMQDQRLANLEGGAQSQQIRAAEDRIIQEVKSLEQDYPAASTDEVIAVRLMAPAHISTEEIMRKSHQWYSSPATIDRLLAANPEHKRALEDKIIKEYQAKKAKAKNIPRKRSRSSGTRRVSTTTPKSKGFGYDFDQAGADAHKQIAELERMARDEA